MNLIYSKNFKIVKIPVVNKAQKPPKQINIQCLVYKILK